MLMLIFFIVMILLFFKLTLLQKLLIFFTKFKIERIAKIIFTIVFVESKFFSEYLSNNINRSNIKNKIKIL